MSKRLPKKSETLEVRLEHEVKSALMRKAHQEGRSTSAFVRSFIHSYLAEQPKEARSMLFTLLKPTAAIGTALLAIIWAAVSPPPLHARPDLKTVFQAIDRDGNGMITADEFVRHPSEPAIQKLHDAHKDGGHSGMAAMHGQAMQVAHTKPSENELKAHFAGIDGDSNGSATFDEFEAFHDASKASHGAR